MFITDNQSFMNSLLNNILLIVELTSFKLIRDSWSSKDGNCPNYGKEKRSWQWRLSDFRKLER